MDKLVKEGKRKADTIPDLSKYENLSDIFINAAGDCVMRPGLFTGMYRILKVPARVILVFVYTSMRVILKDSSTALTD